MKKRIIKFAAVIAFSVLFVGCGKSEIVKTTESAISDIGEVSVDSKEKIEIAEGYYSALTDKQKEQVENVSKLVEARNVYDRLVKENEEQKDEEATEETDDLADVEMTEEENIAVLYLLYYAKGLKNPRSLKVYDIWVSNGVTAQIVASLSAENNFGGSVETTIGPGGFMIIDEGDTWEDVIKADYDYESYLGTGLSNYWKEIDVSSSMVVCDENRLDAERIQKFYDENVYKVK